jgi:hypothetical protein
MMMAMEVTIQTKKIKRDLAVRCYTFFQKHDTGTLASQYRTPSTPFYHTIENRIAHTVLLSHNVMTYHSSGYDNSGIANEISNNILN